MERQQESSGKRIWRLVYPFLTYMGIMLLVGTIASLAISYRFVSENVTEITPDTLNEMMIETVELFYSYYLEIQTASVLCTLPVMIIFFTRDRRRRLQAGAVELLPDRSPLWMAVIAVFGAITSYAANGMISLSGLYQVSDGYDEVAMVFYQGKLFLELICLGVLTPILEELIFRGLMYNQLLETMSKKMAVLLAALLFGAYHGNMLQMIYAFCLGLLMIYVYERFHTLLAPILFHIGANVLGIVLTETSALSFLYSTAAGMYLSVIAASLLVIGAVWLIEERQRQLEARSGNGENMSA